MAKISRFGLFNRPNSSDQARSSASPTPEAAASGARSAGLSEREEVLVSSSLGAQRPAATTNGSADAVLAVASAVSELVAIKREDSERAVAAADSSDSGAAESDSGSDDDAGDTLGLVLASWRSRDGEGLRPDDIWAVYEHQRRLHLKFKRRAERAADEMHRAARVLSEMARESAARHPSSSRPSRAPTISPRPAQPRDRTPALSPRAARHRDRAPTGHQAPRHQSIPSAPGPVTRQGDAPEPLATQRSSGGSSSNSNGGSIVAAGDTTPLLSCERAARPFQFATTLRTAFRLKPRAVFTCQFEGRDEHTSVAYSLDGTVQLWDPQEKRQIQILETDQLKMDFAECMAQATPSILAAVSGGRTGAGPSFDNAGELVFIGQRRLAMRRDSVSLGEVQHWPTPEHDGMASVVEGIMGGRAAGGPGRGMIATGGVRDRKVLVWSLELAGGRVASARVVQRMHTNHGSRLTALCYDPHHARILSGSESGRINANDVETGGMAADGSDDRMQNCVVGSIAMCPTNPHLAMASCGLSDKQYRIIDLRQGQSVLHPALAVGVRAERTLSRYSRPAWHPAGGLIFCPVKSGSPGAPEDGSVAIWDTRYVNCAEAAPQIYRPHTSAVWSVSFAGSDGAGRTTMVTVCGDHNIGFTQFRV
ncbi:hypothetical protein H4R18_004525 [Coemansia javaensis]|uniref:WD40 repeat-like protein n=1 Tax=Coemansia javaensis TaxID=2761396 RepID=A0A9W8H5W3_9FUNG|nr:hypothetical protein H4R18_004525 [Coemansia javaensis]